MSAGPQPPEPASATAAAAGDPPSSAASPAPAPLRDEPQSAAFAATEAPPAEPAAHAKMHSAARGAVEAPSMAPAALPDGTGSAAVAAAVATPASPAPQPNETHGAAVAAAEAPAGASTSRPIALGRAGDPFAAGPPFEPPAAAVATPGPPEEEPAGRLTRFRRWRFAPIVEVVVTIALALALAESVQAAVVKPFVIPTGSMEPTLMPGQRVLVNRLAYDFGSPQRGDIVVFHPPASLTCKVNVPADEPCPESNTTPSSQYFVKRVIGLPGDRLSISGGHPVINGKALTNEPYITQCIGAASCDMPHTIVIPAGEYYMLGDNRGDSDDSRYWGPVPSSWIIGEVFATYWPLDRLGIF